MFDFSQIAQVGESLRSASDDITSRLESLDNKLTLLIILQVMTVQDTYAASTGQRADFQSVLQEALTERERWFGRLADAHADIAEVKSTSMPLRDVTE